MEPVKKLSRSVKGLSVLITGAASGMGRATAHAFADEGALEHEPRNQRPERENSKRNQHRQRRFMRRVIVLVMAVRRVKVVAVGMRIMRSRFSRTRSAKISKLGEGISAAFSGSNQDM